MPQIMNGPVGVMTRRAATCVPADCDCSAVSNSTERYWLELNALLCEISTSNDPQVRETGIQVLLHALGTLGKRRAV